MSVRGTLQAGARRAAQQGYMQGRALGNTGCDLQSRCQREGQRGRDCQTRECSVGPCGFTVFWAQLSDLCFRKAIPAAPWQKAGPQQDGGRVESCL